jgi:hypothetical protein
MSDDKVTEAQAQAAIDKAVRSGDQMALFWMGFALSDFHWSSDSQRGNALALAACELGYDCSVNNPAMPFYTCKYSTTICSGVSDYSEWLATGIGPDLYATSYAKAQELKQYLASQPDQAVAFAKIYRKLSPQEQEELQRLLDAASP